MIHGAIEDLRRIRSRFLRLWRRCRLYGAWKIGRLNGRIPFRESMPESFIFTVGLFRFAFFFLGGGFVHAAKWHSVFFFFAAELFGGEWKEALSHDSRSDFVLDRRTRCLLQFHDRRFFRCIPLMKYGRSPLQPTA